MKKYKLVLVSAPQLKIETIKMVRYLSGLGLKEAKDLVDAQIASYDCVTLIVSVAQLPYLMECMGKSGMRFDFSQYNDTPRVLDFSEREIGY